MLTWLGLATALGGAMVGCSSEESEAPATHSSTSSGSGGGTTSGGQGGEGAAPSGGQGGTGGAGGSGGDDLAYECPATLDPCPAFPTAQWATESAAALGIDESKIDAFIQATGNQHGIFTRYGYQVRSWGSSDGKFGWASASKPVFATLLMFAVQEGKLNGVDDLIGDWSWNLTSADQGMTFRQLANMTSGYGLSESPGQAWAYNDYAIKLYALTLVDQVFTDGTADQIAGQGTRLGPLAFQDGDLFALQNGAPRVTTTPRDFARIGWFWLNHGRWADEQLLAASSFEEHLTPGVPSSLPRTAGGTVDDYLGLGSYGGGADQTGLGPGIYGFNWWFNPGGQTWPAAPADTVQANGHWNGEVLTFIPSLAIVAAWKGNGASPESFNEPMNTILAALIETVLP